MICRAIFVLGSKEEKGINVLIKKKAKEPSICERACVCVCVVCS